MPKKMFRDLKGKLTLLTPLAIDLLQVRFENTISTEEAVQLIKQNIVRPRSFSPVCKVYFSGDVCKLMMEVRKILEYIDETNRIVADAIVEYIVDGTPPDRLCTAREIKLSVFKNACSIVETFVCLPLLKRKKSDKQYRGYIYKPLDKVRIVFDLKKDYEMMNRCLERGEDEEQMAKRINEEKRLSSVHVIEDIKPADAETSVAPAPPFNPQMRRQKTLSTSEAIELIQAKCYLPHVQSPIAEIRFTGTRSQLMRVVATIVRYTSRAGIGELSDAILEHIVNERPFRTISERMRISLHPFIDALWNVQFFVQDIVPLETEHERAMRLPLHHSKSFSATLYVQTGDYRIVNNLKEDYLRCMRGVEENMDVEPELQRYEANRKNIFLTVDDDVALLARNKIGDRLSKKLLTSRLLLASETHYDMDLDETMINAEGGNNINQPVKPDRNPAMTNTFIFPVSKSPVAVRYSQVKASSPQQKAVPPLTKLHAKTSMEMIRDSLLKKPPQRNLTENEVNLIQRGTHTSDEVAATSIQPNTQTSPSVSAAAKPMYKLIREPGKPARLVRCVPEPLSLTAPMQVPKKEEQPNDFELKDEKPTHPVHLVKCNPAPPLDPTRVPKREEPDNDELMTAVPQKTRKLSNNLMKVGSFYMLPPPNMDYEINDGNSNNSSAAALAKQSYQQPLHFYRVPVQDASRYVQQGVSKPPYHPVPRPTNNQHIHSYSSSTQDPRAAKTPMQYGKSIGTRLREAASSCKDREASKLTFKPVPDDSKKNIYPTKTPKIEQDEDQYETSSAYLSHNNPKIEETSEVDPMQTDDDTNRLKYSVSYMKLTTRLREAAARHKREEEAKLANKANSAQPSPSTSQQQNLSIVHGTQVPQQPMLNEMGIKREEEDPDLLQPSAFSCERPEGGL